MIRVVLESPYGGAISRNVTYARRCVRDCLQRGETPVVSHLLFTQPGILRDEEPEERVLGMAAGHAWINVCDFVVVYHDYGVSPGMLKGLDVARAEGKNVAYRLIGKNQGDAC
jgi:hypothetical protein